MRTSWPYVGVFAAAVLVVAVVGLRRGDDQTDRATPPPAVHAQTAAPALPPALPDTARRETIAVTRPPRPELPAVSPAAAAPLWSTRDEVVVPTTLPVSPSLDAELSRNGTVRDFREVYTYQLGLMAFYQRCMKGRIAHGVIYYFIRWQVDQNHVASAPAFDSAGVPNEGEVTPDDEHAFASCVTQYLAMHDHVMLPHGGDNGEAWGMRAVFPLQDSPLLKMIADAKP